MRSSTGNQSHGTAGEGGKGERFDRTAEPGGQFYFRFHASELSELQEHPFLRGPKAEIRRQALLSFSALPSLRAAPSRAHGPSTRLPTSPKEPPPHCTAPAPSPSSSPQPRASAGLSLSLLAAPAPSGPVPPSSRKAAPLHPPGLPPPRAAPPEARYLRPVQASARPPGERRLLRPPPPPPAARGPLAPLPSRRPAALPAGQTVAPPDRKRRSKRARSALLPTPRRERTGGEAEPRRCGDLGWFGEPRIPRGGRQAARRAAPGGVLRAGGPARVTGRCGGGSGCGRRGAARRCFAVPRDVTAGRCCVCERRVASRRGAVW